MKRQSWDWNLNLSCSNVWAFIVILHSLLKTRLCLEYHYTCSSPKYLACIWSFLSVHGINELYTSLACLYGQQKMSWSCSPVYWLKVLTVAIGISLLFGARAPGGKMKRDQSGLRVSNFLASWRPPASLEWARREVPQLTEGHFNRGFCKFRINTPLPLQYFQRSLPDQPSVSILVIVGHIPLVGVERAGKAS